MATYITLLALLMALLIASASPTTRNKDLVVAIEEMQRANYFTFVTLVNLSPIDLFQGNVTFLMPNDRMLAKINTMPKDAISDFLLRHSIPSPLLFDHLEHIPTGSIIPTKLPDYTLEISNNGRRSYFLNNVKIISINICTAGSSIRCHGIDGVLLPPNMMPDPTNTSAPLPTCSNHTSPLPAATPPTPSSLPSPNSPLIGGATALPPSDHPNVGPQKSAGSSMWLSYGILLEFVVTSCMMLILGPSLYRIVF